MVNPPTGYNSCRNPRPFRARRKSKVKEYLSDKDASHIKSHNRGGSGHPDNIKWENKSINRARGDRNMTCQKQIKLDIRSQFDNLTGALKAGIKAAPKGAVIGAVTADWWSAAILIG